MVDAEIRAMTPEDLRLCVGLFGLVGWGNTADDVRRMLSYEPGGCFVATVGGVGVGIVASTSYGCVGFVGNLIVRPDQRGRGIGASLMRAAMTHLLDAGARSVRLDSVPRAVPLYRRLGFREEYPSLRFTGAGGRLPWEGVERMTPTDLPGVLELDRRFFGAHRGRILERVLRDFPGLCFVAREESIVGYIMAKAGEGVYRIGPWICEPRRPEVAESLLHRLMSEVDGQRLWAGVPGVNEASAEMLKGNGFDGLPSSLRMCYGECVPMGDPRGIFGVGAPDKG
jgi:GNAT superfamily N-acetyltransferase